MLWGGKRCPGTHANIFCFISVHTNCPGLDPVFTECPHASYSECSLTPPTSLFALNTLKTLENNLPTDPDFQHHCGASQAHFNWGCQLLHANSKQHLEIHANSWINTICSLETCLHFHTRPHSPSIRWPEAGPKNPKFTAATWGSQFLHLPCSRLECIGDFGSQGGRGSR